MKSKSSKIFLTAVFSSISINQSHAQASGPELVLEPLVVTGSNLSEPLKDAPVRTELIDREMIERSGSRDLAEAIEYSPGLRVQTTCGNCNQQEIQMLGLPQSYISILTDGLPTFSSLAGVYGIEQIPSGLIGQIEVVKGGGSALYGSGAVAGVINIIPRDPTKTGGELDFSIGTTAGEGVNNQPDNDAFGLYDWVLPEQDLKITAFGNYGFRQAVDFDGDGFSEVSERELRAGGLRVVWEPSSATKLAFDYFISDEDRRGGETGAAFDGPPNLAIIAEELFSTRQVASLKWNQELSQTFDLQLAYAYARTRRDSYYGGTVSLGSPDPLSPFFDATWTKGRGFGQTASDLHFLDGLWNWNPSEQHRVSMGLQYRNEHLSDAQSSVGSTLDETYENFGALLQHRWEPNDFLTLEYGARVDVHSEVADPIISPRVTVMVEPASNFRFRNSVGFGFRAPEAFDEDLHISNVGGELQSVTQDPSLKEESAVTFSIAPEWQITDNWRLETNFFYTQLRDTFVTNPADDAGTPDVTEFVKSNGGDSEIFGAEINLGYFATDWQVEFSWVEQRLEYGDRQLFLGDDTLTDPIDNPVFGSRYPRTPESLGLVKFTHKGEWFDAFIAAKLTGPMDIPHVVTDDSGNQVENRLERSPWFVNLDVGISKEFQVGSNDTLTVSLGCKNILNSFQDDGDQGAYRDAGYFYGPAFPRTVFAGMKWEF